MAEIAEATRWGVRVAPDDRIRINVNGIAFDFVPRDAAELARTIRVILGLEAVDA